MEKFLKGDLKWIAANVILWTVAKLLFLAIKLWGVKSTVFHAVDLPVEILFLAVAFTGVIDGFVFGLIDEAVDKQRIRVSFLKLVVTKSLINLLAGLTLNICLLPLFLNLTFSEGVYLVFKTFMDVNLVVIAVFIFLNTCLLQLMKAAACWVQTIDLREIFSIHKPGVQEDRIFMFMDMKSSTGHAENMGVQQYSLMLQDCFQDMTHAVQETCAEIYQYVGDEIVFTWKTSRLNLRRTFLHYFYIRQRLRGRSQYYRDRYGIVPEFKAGIHMGTVMRTHVGMMRKSVAFHGDTVNTASRIQGKCNELGQNLLVSSAMVQGLPSRYHAEYEGTFLLRGKHREICLFSVHDSMDGRQDKVISNQCYPEKVKLSPFRIWLNVF